MTKIYYLQWHRQEPYGNERASNHFSEFHYDPPSTLSKTSFNELYELVSVIETTDLEDIYAEWNRGSGRESRDFLELRYCTRCQSYVERVDEAITHAAQNHGYDALSSSSEPDYILSERSMSVGDIVERNDRYYSCAPFGWREIDIVSSDGGQTTSGERYVEDLEAPADTDNTPTLTSYHEWLEDIQNRMVDIHGSANCYR